MGLSMSYRDDASGSAGNFDLVNDVPEALGWQRKRDLDEGAREAWELRDGTVLLLDPTGGSDARVCRPRQEASGGWFGVGMPAFRPA